MLNNNYSEAAVEVLDILKYTNADDVKKIPKKFIKFLEQNCSQNYISKIDKHKSIKEMNLRQETKDLLGIIYRNWWASPEEKKEIYHKLSEMKNKEQQKLNEMNSYDNLFKNKRIENKKFESEKVTTTQLTEYKEGLFKRILNKIKNFFNKE